MGRARAAGIFGLGLLAGGLLGGAAALVLAPRAGRETRAEVRRAADDGRGVLRGARQEVETVAPVT